MADTPVTIVPENLYVMGRIRKPTAIGSSAIIDIAIVNERRSPIKDCTIFLERSDYNYSNVVNIPNVDAYSYCDTFDDGKPLCIEMKCTAQATEYNLPECITLVLRNRNREPMLKTTVETEFRFFNTGLSTISSGMKHVPWINILVVGKAGAGKSSFQQTLLTCMSDEKQVKYHSFVASGCTDHSTRRLTKIPLPNTQAKFCDTWGFRDDNYLEGQELDLMLAGGLPDNWPLDANPADYLEDMKKHRASQPSRRIHAVCYMVPVAALHDDANKKGQQAFFGRLKTFGHNPIVVLSLVDDAFDGLRGNPLERTAELDAERRLAAATFGVPLAQVTYTLNYVGEKERNLEIEKLAYHNTDMIIRAGETYCKHIHDQIVDRPANTKAASKALKWEED